jgi:hypothetical protein
MISFIKVYEKYTVDMNVLTMTVPLIEAHSQAPVLNRMWWVFSCVGYTPFPSGPWSVFCDFFRQHEGRLCAESGPASQIFERQLSGKPTLMLD